MGSSPPTPPWNTLTVLSWLITKPSTSILPSSKLTWSHTHVSISHWLHMLQSSPPRRLTTSSSPLPRSPMLASSQPIKWSSVIHVTVNTRPVVCCTVVMSSPRMSTPPLPPSRPREPSNSLTGAQLVSRSVSTTNHQPSSQVVILPRSNVPSACCPTPPPLPKHGPVLTTSSISCTPNVPSSTGMLVKVWKKVNSPKPVRILPPSRRITKKSVSTPSKVKPKKEKMNTKLFFNFCNFKVFGLL